MTTANQLLTRYNSLQQQRIDNFYHRLQSK